MQLKRRLDAVSNIFNVCIIDAPPQRLQICLTVIGTADFLLIPAEASVKGYGSLVRTLDLRLGFTLRWGNWLRCFRNFTIS